MVLLIDSSPLIVVGSIQWPLLRLDVYGSLRADGQSGGKKTINGNSSLIGGLGGGSGGTILLFLEELTLENRSLLSVVGGNGGFPGGGGGGGGRVHFHWSKIYVGIEYVPVATIHGSINSRFNLFFHALYLTWYLSYLHETLYIKTVGVGIYIFLHA